MNKQQEDCIKECIREIDTIKRRLTGLLASQKIDVFEKPLFDDVFNHFLSSMEYREGSLEARRFYDYYESNGWKVGKNKMKNWKSAISGWHSRNLKNTEGKQHGQQSQHRSTAQRAFDAISNLPDD